MKTLSDPMATRHSTNQSCVLPHTFPLCLLTACTSICQHPVVQYDNLYNFSLESYYFKGRKFRRQKLSRFREFFGRSRKLIPAKSYFTLQVAKYHLKFDKNCTKIKKKCKNTGRSRKFIPAKLNFGPRRSRKFIPAKLNTRETFYL